MLRQRFGSTPVVGDRLVVVHCQLLIISLPRQREVDAALRAELEGSHSRGRSEVAVVLTSAVLYLPLTAIT